MRNFLQRIVYSTIGIAFLNRSVQHYIISKRRHRVGSCISGDNMIYSQPRSSPARLVASLIAFIGSDTRKNRASRLGRLGRNVRAALAALALLVLPAVIGTAAAQTPSMLDEPVTQTSAGLFHTAILYPTRRDLAVALQRLIDAKYPITGASDHGVSEAIYLNDPDQNGVELYWDRPMDQWPHKPDGSIEMYTHALDLNGLLGELP